MVWVYFYTDKKILKEISIVALFHTSREGLTAI